jgi:hypothetical protein
MTAEALQTQDIAALAKQLGQQILDEIRALIANQQTKEYYTTEELATALDKKPFTIREHWCNAGRIECEKEENGKWRIPGHEYRRLVNGGGLNPKRQ